MKKNLLLLSALFLFLTACGKKDCCVLPQQQFITAEKNSAHWTADPTSSNLVGDTVAIFGTNFTTTIEETLTLQFKAAAPGKYSLKGKQASYYNTIGRDVIVSEYKLDETFANSVEITAFNKDSSIIAGTFSIKLKHTYPADKPANLQFLNGKFQIKLQKYK